MLLLRLILLPRVSVLLELVRLLLPSLQIQEVVQLQIHLLASSSPTDSAHAAAAAGMHVIPRLH